MCGGVLSVGTPVLHFRESSVHLAANQRPHTTRPALLIIECFPLPLCAAAATGAASLQNALDTGVALLRNIPPYGHREMLVRVCMEQGHELCMCVHKK